MALGLRFLGLALGSRLSHHHHFSVPWGSSWLISHDNSIDVIIFFFTDWDPLDLASLRKTWWDGCFIILVSYEKIFGVRFYCGHMRLGNHLCPKEKVEDGCFMIDRVFDDEPPIFPEDTRVDKDMKVALQNDTLLCFPTHVIQDEEPTDNVEGEQRMVVDGPEADGWTTMVPRWHNKVNKRQSVELVWEDKTPKDVSKILKYKWVARADLVQD